MWIYILRRLLLMIPTLFGVTVVSFVIMQLSPGDPTLERFKSSGTAGASTQTREAYLIMKRDLKLDRPLLLNFRDFVDHAPALRIAAHYRALTTAQIAEDLKLLQGTELSPELAERKSFLQELRIDKGERIDKFEARLNPTRPPDISDDEWQGKVAESHRSLAQAVEAFVMVWCENLGAHGVRPTLEIMRAGDAPLNLRVGAIKAMQGMVLSPFDYTFPMNATPDDVQRVLATWRILWQREQGKYPPVEPERAALVKKTVGELAADITDGARTRTFAYIVNADLEADKFMLEDAATFAEILLGDHPLPHKAIAAEALRLYIPARVETDVPLEATVDDVSRVAENWSIYFDAHAAEYERTAGQKLWAVFADTQYSHMVWRLLTFNFGRSTLKTREPVAEKLWSAAAISAPLMLMAEVIIFAVALPFGVACAIYRGQAVDRAGQLFLFLVYSMPAYVAAMLSLLFLAYGKFLKIFPMERLHSSGYESFTWPQYLADYFWHAALPVACLSLFSWPGIAQYTRSSMLDVLGQDYIRTARAKGLSPFWVYGKHAFRNGLITVITLFSSFLPALLGGSVLVEYIFNINGMGRLGLTCIENKDFPTLMALTYVNAIVVMVSILLTDLLYVAADPRISFEAQDKS